MAAAGEKIIENSTAAKVTGRAPLKWGGTRAPRPDGVDKVTGRAKFGADTYLPNMLIGKVPVSYTHLTLPTICSV